MDVDTRMTIPMAEADVDFAKVVRLVDESGMAVITKDAEPRYTMLSFADYSEMQAARRQLVSEVMDSVISENIEAIRELAK